MGGCARILKVKLLRAAERSWETFAKRDTCPGNGTGPGLSGRSPNPPQRKVKVKFEEKNAWPAEVPERRCPPRPRSSSGARPDACHRARAPMYMVSGGFASLGFWVWSCQIGCVALSSHALLACFPSWVWDYCPKLPVVSIHGPGGLRQCSVHTGGVKALSLAQAAPWENARRTVRR